MEQPGEMCRLSSPWFSLSGKGTNPDLVSRVYGFEVLWSGQICVWFELPFLERAPPRKDPSFLPNGAWVGSLDSR